MSTIVTICTWLGPDDYQHMNDLRSVALNQLNELKEIYHPLLKKTIKVSVRGVAATGSSTAAATYPIPEAPERSDQLGDMTLICQSPVGEIENNSENKYK